ncbi:ribulose-phosphate 3-epimerase [Salinicoccus sp. ID82-1]|uniref:Ribulose-phosphate 3-epimerase n=1 Tax=Salinicoccus cyprini TaxID=2493691 RepID=A0A558AY22_9STAP|nr:MULTISPECIES: ribulose-phosphate 3-epimerase [Salinicoccus]MCG1008682.1 ribulose-phosphate 3-epimerase [Salinicoccus sp. ID82-1]TVT29159.1 ribulose-phosphate 3-epimerase [Salinicoccus cyprini]
MVKILPSLLASDFAKLGEDIRKMEEAGADIFHLDIMDGQFVPNISYGLPVVEAISRTASIPLDVHLMTHEPEQFIDEFSRMDISMVSFHIEATNHPHRLMQRIQESGMKAGIVLNPHTPVSLIEHLLPEIDFILIMTVNPGFGGQKFIGSGVLKIEQLDALRQENDYGYEIEVDGGINDETAGICRAAGADLLVSGSHLFKSEDWKAAVSRMKG